MEAREGRNGVESNIRVGNKNCAMDLENIAPYLTWSIEYRGNNWLFIRMRYNATKKNHYHWLDIIIVDAYYGRSCQDITVRNKGTRCAWSLIIQRVSSHNR